MIFKIEYGEKRFAVVDPDGDPSDAATYCSFSSLEYKGRVYAAYLNGEEEEIDPGPDEPNTLVPSPTATVYDITDWPQVIPMETVSEEVEFEEDAEPEVIA